MLFFIPYQNMLNFVNSYFLIEPTGASKFFIFGFLIFLSGFINAQVVTLYPTYQSIGIQIKDITDADSCLVEYKESTHSVWLKAFAPDRIIISGQEQFRGSLFLLSENTEYDVRVTVFYQSTYKILPSIKQFTKSKPVFASSHDVKWVSPSGFGNLYTEANPGDINILFSSGRVDCGTTVLLKGGIYNAINGLALNLKGDCSESLPIVIEAAPGAKPIVDGGLNIKTTWILHPGIKDLYYTSLPTEAGHSNICIMDSVALYAYPSVNPEVSLGNYNLSELNFDYDGFVRDDKTIWIKTKGGINPGSKSVVVSKSSRFLTVYGNDKNAYLKVKGIYFRYFGKPILNGLGSPQDSYSATVFDLRNLHHVYFDSCIFVYNTNHISFSGQCNDYTIQNCVFKHDVGKWSHAMIKKSHDFNNTFFGSISSSRARAVETPAIFTSNSKQAVIRNNLFDGVNSGVESYFDSGLNEEMDIYNNIFVDNFDALECDGIWANLRAWNNEMIRPMAGISAAPPLIGPRYFYRNTFHGMKGRINEKDDPYFIGCEPIGTNYRGQAIGIKTNSGYSGIQPRGNIYFINNTFHAEDTMGFVYTSWESEWRKIYFINNSYSQVMHYPIYFFDLANTLKNQDFQLYSSHDNYFTLKQNIPIAVAKHIHGRYECTEIDNVLDLQITLSRLSGSTNIEIDHPLQVDPRFSNTSVGGFELSQHSPLIDAGIIVDGFNDYQGLRPDIGAKESIYSVSLADPDKDIDFKVFPNPVKDLLNVEFSGSLKELKLIVKNEMGMDLIILHSAIKSNHQVDCSALNEGFYILEVFSEGVRKSYKFVKAGL